VIERLLRPAMSTKYRAFSVNTVPLTTETPKVAETTQGWRRWRFI
jgi:hypothetical protein